MPDAHLIVPIGILCAAIAAAVIDRRRRRRRGAPPPTRPVLVAACWTIAWTMVLASWTLRPSALRAWWAISNDDDVRVLVEATLVPNAFGWTGRVRVDPGGLARAAPASVEADARLRSWWTAPRRASDVACRDRRVAFGVARALAPRDAERATAIGADLAAFLAGARPHAARARLLRETGVAIWIHDVAPPSRAPGRSHAGVLVAVLHVAAGAIAWSVATNGRPTAPSVPRPVDRPPAAALRDATCPGCRHPIRGGRGRTCTECGASLEAGVVPGGAPHPLEFAWIRAIVGIGSIASVLVVLAIAGMIASALAGVLRTSMGSRLDGFGSFDELVMVLGAALLILGPTVALIAAIADGAREQSRLCLVPLALARAAEERDSTAEAPRNAEGRGGRRTG